VRRTAFVLSLTVASVAGLVGAALAQGCSCAAVAPETKFRLSDAAVIARLVDVVPRGEHAAVFRYRVREVFKGKNRIEEGQRLSLRSATSSAACGLPHGEGHRYGLFLSRTGDHWSATLCDVTTPRGMREAAGGGGGSGYRPTCAR
jgi:hypothetical protein